MIGRYKQVCLDDAGPGLVLGADVLDEQGGVLLPRGAQLTDALLRALRRRGVGSVRAAAEAPGVATPGGATPGVATPGAADLAAERARVRRRIGELFRNPGPGGADALLRERLAAWRMEALE